ncbi:MAG: low molecular weight protein-tyrosine-phosphatase [Actinomycetaceae bacterium]|nr:low molecular weight protein-tyrosine-phosphatase [Actinomycetaceae bacterium]
MTYRVMMVCTGNICRSAMAEVVVNAHLRQAGIDAVVVSSGVSNEEQGNPIDYRAQRTLRNAGYVVPDREAQQIQPADLEECDLILAMTYRHLQSIESLAKRLQIPLTDKNGGEKLFMFRVFDPQGQLVASSGRKNVDFPQILDVPDPWYGTQADFEETLATIERSVPALLAEITARIGK